MATARCPSFRLPRQAERVVQSQGRSFLTREEICLYRGKLMGLPEVAEQFALSVMVLYLCFL